MTTCTSCITSDQGLSDRARGQQVELFCAAVTMKTVQQDPRASSMLGSFTSGSGGNSVGMAGSSTGGAPGKGATVCGPSCSSCSQRCECSRYIHQHNIRTSARAGVAGLSDKCCSFVAC